MKPTSIDPYYDFRPFATPALAYGSNADSTFEWWVDANKFIWISLKGQPAECPCLNLAQSAIRRYHPDMDVDDLLRNTLNLSEETDHFYSSLGK